KIVGSGAPGRQAGEGRGDLMRLAIRESGRRRGFMRQTGWEAMRSRWVQGDRRAALASTRTSMNTREQRSTAPMAFRLGGPKVSPSVYLSGANPPLTGCRGFTATWRRSWAYERFGREYVRCRAHHADAARAGGDGFCESCKPVA